MDIISVEYRRLHSFGNYENEEFGAVAEVRSHERPEDVMEGLKHFVADQIQTAEEKRGEKYRVQDDVSEALRELRELNGHLQIARERWDKVKAFLEKHGVTVEDLEIPF